MFTAWLAAGLGWAAPPADLAALEQGFRQPPLEARPMMRWWWFGPAVTKAGLEREMRLMKAGGIGGFEVQPVYPLTLDDPAGGVRNLPFLSQEFLEALRFTAAKARELGLRFDLTLGSGWPYGGPSVAVTEAAGRLRCDRVPIVGARRIPLPALAAGEKLITAMAVRTPGKAGPVEVARELSPGEDGAVRLAEADSANEVWFFIASRTGQQVKRAAVGAEGFVVNHYDRAAVESFLAHMADPAMKALGQDRPYAVFCDSLEVFASDWTGDLLEEFQRRRGYDLKPHLPALVAEAGAKTAGIRHDWAKTLTELLEERFYRPMHAWAQRQQTRFRIQGYGVPPAALSSFAHTDLPEGEGSQWKILRASRWASSASHIYGRPVTSSETWTWLHSPVFRATPLDVKAEADLHFLQGINQLIGHGWPYTAEGQEYPGWRFYAAAVFNEKNPWWIVMPDLTAYLSRLSFLLRQGRPVNDVALYLPNADAWAHMSAGRVHLIETLRERIGPDVIARILEAGYNLDFFDDGMLESVGRVEKGALALGQSRYRVVVLPGVETIPLATLRKLEEFARGGGGLIATRRLPSRAPGFRATEAEHQEVHTICQRLFEGGPARFVADENRELAATLARQVRPDVAFSPAAPEVGFVHRSAPSAEIYFVANTANEPRRVKAAFRVEGMEAEVWDALTGQVRAAEVAERGAGRTTLALDLDPYGSRVIVFTKVRRLAPTVKPAEAAAPAPIDLSAGWAVTFANGRRVTMDRLRSWTEDESTRFYSGVATYEREVTVAAELLEGGLKWTLDLGPGQPLPVGRRRNGMQAWMESPVREAAVVYVNGQRAGSVWCPPYAVEVTGLLKPGVNRIRIEVANLAVNHMAGRRLPDYRLLNLRYGVRFEPQDMDQIRAEPSGLLGPVRLVPGRQ